MPRRGDLIAKKGGKGGRYRARCPGTEDGKDPKVEKADGGKNGKGGTAEKGGDKGGRKDDDHPGYRVGE